VRLQNVETNEIKVAKVVLSDSNMGYLASYQEEKNPEWDIWEWFHPDQWKEIK
tara:strand:- start:403 stop:561 length:159 start_codon:yes stop_codon:yes gene_type:complete